MNNSSASNAYGIPLFQTAGAFAYAVAIKLCCSLLPAPGENPSVRCNQGPSQLLREPSTAANALFAFFPSAQRKSFAFNFTRSDQLAIDQENPASTRLHFIRQQA